MDQYLILLKGTRSLDYSPAELQFRLEEYRAWVETVKQHYITDNRLEHTGAQISSNGDVVTDGPFLEAKEIIAGYIVIQADDLEQATSIAASSPLLKYFEIYVRPIVSNTIK